MFGDSPDEWASKIGGAMMATVEGGKEKLPAGHVPIITMGRLGSLISYPVAARPSDDAFISLFRSARKSIKCSLQDLGPICIPFSDRITVPTCVWPKDYMKAFGMAILERDVQLHIALSNPKSIPDGLSPTQAQYGNGWHLSDVAAELVKAIKELNSALDDQKLTELVMKNIKLCFIGQSRGHEWSSGMNMGNHAKHFIIDDECYYIGSQNLYIADLAEWGVLVDDKEATRKCMEVYWNPMWEHSYREAEDKQNEVNQVMQGLLTNRDGEKPCCGRTAAVRQAAIDGHSKSNNHRVEEGMYGTKWQAMRNRVKVGRASGAFKK